MKKNNGFTLIETLIYSVLLSLIIAGSLVGVYQIISSSDKLSTKAFIEQEGNFLLRKINWALTGATVIYSPDINSYSAGLKLDKINPNDPDNPLELEFASSSKKIILKQDGNLFDLSSDYLEVSDLIFCYGTTSIPECENGQPNQIKASFKVDGQLFKITKYLRK